LVRHVDGTLAAFVEACAQRTPTPGGGAASALIAAVGAALGAMALRFSRDDDPANAAALATCERIRRELLALVDADCAGYEKLAAALKLPKGPAPEHAAARRRAVQDGLRAAMEPPLSGARLCAEGLAAIAARADAVNRHLASDAAICALALSCAFDGFARNVRGNAAGIDDPAVRGAAEEEIAQLHDAAAAARDATLRGASGRDSA
jgi:formiminotetrahydrofolate cyclodeaminase